jgi:hypothetical protein
MRHLSLAIFTKEIVEGNHMIEQLSNHTEEIQRLVVLRSRCGKAAVSPNLQSQVRNRFGGIRFLNAACCCCHSCGNCHRLAWAKMPCVEFEGFSRAKVLKSSPTLRQTVCRSEKFSLISRESPAFRAFLSRIWLISVGLARANSGCQGRRVS